MGNIIDLNAFRQKKEGREPLYISHLDGKVKGDPNLTRPSAEDFGDRLQRIRTSLNKINSLMAELKRQAKERQDETK